MKIFLSGIMQGSQRAMVLHDQGYRQRLKQLLQQHLPGADVYDPLEDHGRSVDYDDRTGRQVFFHHNAMCREVDAVVAYVPEASMGTAIEMWEAYRAGRAVIAISPLEGNWSVRYCSHAIYPDVEAFQEALEAGQVQRCIAEARASADS